MKFIKNTVGLDKYQYGYQNDSNTQAAVSDFIGSISEELDKGHQVAALFFDFSKAFDTIDHKLLEDKLEDLGIRGIAL